MPHHFIHDRQKNIPQALKIHMLLHYRMGSNTTDRQTALQSVGVETTKHTYTHTTRRLSVSQQASQEQDWVGAASISRNSQLQPHPQMSSVDFPSLQKSYLISYTGYFCGITLTVLIKAEVV
jgi:hypothetical protein